MVLFIGGQSYMYFIAELNLKFPCLFDYYGDTISRTEEVSLYLLLAMHCLCHIFLLSLYIMEENVLCLIFSGKLKRGFI